MKCLLSQVKARLHQRLQELEPLPELLRTTELRLHEANEKLLQYERRNSENTKLIAELTAKVEREGGGGGGGWRSKERERERGRERGRQSVHIYACEHAIQCSAQMNNLVIKQVYILCFVVVVFIEGEWRGRG